MSGEFTGIFWDIPKPQPKVSEEKRTPPARTWEQPDYLPGLEQARKLPVHIMTTWELDAAQKAREVLIFDCEVYRNYILFAFMSFETGKVFYLEEINGVEGLNNSYLERDRLKWILENFLIVTFNGNLFDLPIATLALDGQGIETIKACADEIIVNGVKPWIILRRHKLQAIKPNHIDLIEVAPLMASLKIYGGRIHVPRMQELPFAPSAALNADQIAIVRWYCIGADLPATAYLLAELSPQVELRSQMSVAYGVDLRSKSDAQIAEAVICNELKRLSYIDPQRPEIPPGTAFQYKVPYYINFENESLKKALETVRAARFIIGESGAPELPEEIKALKIRIGSKLYQMGIGGLHSQETRMCVYADQENFLLDRDVASYYPAIILNQGLHPKHLGRDFLTVYKTLVDRRLKAKKEKNKLEADTLKIVINGSFGKFGSKYSVLYAPDLMVQVTITGQLTLLMLVERLHLFGAGAEVCSANTDGVLFRCHKSKRETLNKIIAQWEKETGFTTEETEYLGVFARDVNNYIAVKSDLKTKVKGFYAEKGSAGDYVLSKNPQSLICNDAAVAFLTKGVPIETTVNNCRDLRRFVTVRTVKGGAVWPHTGQYLGKAIRFYYATNAPGEFVYAKNGNKVPLSDGAFPCMELPAEFPGNVDFARYIRQAYDILREVGYIREPGEEIERPEDDIDEEPEPLEKPEQKVIDFYAHIKTRTLTNEVRFASWHPPIPEGATWLEYTYGESTICERIEYLADYMNRRGKLRFGKLRYEQDFVPL